MKRLIPRNWLRDITYDQFLEDLKTYAPNLANYDPNYNMKRGWELYGKPQNFSQALYREFITFNPNDGSFHSRSIAYDKDNDRYEFLKGKNHPTRWMELQEYNKNKNFKANWEFVEEEDGKPAMYVKRLQ